MAVAKAKPNLSVAKGKKFTGTTKDLLGDDLDDDDDDDGSFLGGASSEEEVEESDEIEEEIVQAKPKKSIGFNR